MLIRENPFTAKLSSFELTTEILPRAAIGKIYHPKHVVDEERSLISTVPAEAPIAEKYNKLSKQHFYNRTSLMIFKNSSPVESGNEYRLPHSAAYRSMFAMHYYQAPELLIPSIDAGARSVLPSTRSDIFSLGLLLWEAVNHCVPFVIYNYDELIVAYKQNDAKLPMINKSSATFSDIFESCLRFNSDERFSNVFEFISKLDCVHRDDDKDTKNATIPKPIYSHLNMETKKNFKNARITEKLPEKIYFTRDGSNDTDPQKRSENAITAENLQNLQPNDTSLASVSVDLDARLAPFHQQPGIFNNELILDRIRKTVEDQRVIAPKKPFRRTDQSPDTLEASRRSLTDSTMYHSFFDFNRLHTPKVDKDVMYERTSTLKKRMKKSDAQLPKKSIKGLFENAPANKMNDAFNKMDEELNKIKQEYNKSDFMNEIAREFNDRKKELDHGTADLSRSFEELPSNTDVPVIKRSESDNFGTSYRFSVGDYALPKTPIARQNKIRRNAWLSDSKKPSGGRVSDAIKKLNKSGSDLKVNNNSPGNESWKQYNVSIKIHHNDLNKSSKPQKNSNKHSPVNVLPDTNQSRRVNNTPSKTIHELENSRNVDLNKKYYPMMPEMLSDVIQNKRDRSGFLHVTEHGMNSEAEIEELNEKDEANIVPIRTSVRDAVKFIESTFKPETQEIPSPGRRRSSVALQDDVFASPTSFDEPHQSQVVSPSVGIVQNTKKSDDVNLCLMQASESIQRLNDIFQTSQAQETSYLLNNQPVSVTKRIETCSYLTPKKITTKVTVNMKKISRRASDVDHLKKFQEQSRNSICNNAELVKRIQMHFEANDTSLQLERKNSAISASCGSLVSKENTEELVQHQGKCSKYFCRNCGFTMLPAEVLQKIQSSGRISIASSLAEGLQSIKCDEGSPSMTALMKFRPISVSF